MPYTPPWLGRAAVLLLAFVAALPGQNLVDATSVDAPHAEAAIEPHAELEPTAANGDLIPTPLANRVSPLEAYVLGPGDVLLIHVVEAADSFRDAMRVSTSGDLHLPLAGNLHAAGLTIPEFEDRLSDRLRLYVRNPHVAVNVMEYRSRPVTVVGAVQNPGVQILFGEQTLLEVISRAGGLRPEAGQSVQITRQLAWGALPIAGAHFDRSGQFSIAKVNLKDVLSGQSAAENLVIRPQDVISIPRGEMVYVVGAVRQASGFVLEQRNSLSVLEVLSLAGGFAPKAAPQRAVILRPGEEGSSARIQVAVNLKSILEGKDADLELGSDDVLYVPYSGAKIAAERAVNAAITIGTGLLIWRR